jgi:hypothetical protein
MKNLYCIFLIFITIAINAQEKFPDVQTVSAQFERI